MKRKVKVVPLVIPKILKTLVAIKDIRICCVAGEDKHAMCAAGCCNATISQKDDVFTCITNVPYNTGEFTFTLRDIQNTDKDSVFIKTDGVTKRLGKRLNEYKTIQKKRGFYG